MAEKTNPKAAANLTVDRMGGVDEAIESFKAARGFAEKTGDAEAVEVFNQCIAEAEKLR